MTAALLLSRLIRSTLTVRSLLVGAGAKAAFLATLAVNSWQDTEAEAG
jgi:hypothetical protein